MNTLTAYIEGIGLRGPGLTGWPASRAILAGQSPYQYQKTELPSPTLLPPVERRRCGPIVKLSLAVGVEAAEGFDLTRLPTVFSASGGDGDNCHVLCEMLASDDRQISPTRFHNSVHNAAAGYWSIAAAATASSSVLCAYDASFGAGLLEALTQVAVEHAHSLLIACDTTYPHPLRSARPVPDELGVGLVLAAECSAKSIAKISVALTNEPASRMDDDDALERLRISIPAARSLPLMRVVARGEGTRVVLGYLDHVQLAVEVVPCN